MSGTEIIGGTINDTSAAPVGTIDVTGDSTIDGNATLNNGFVTVESAVLTLDNVTVSGSTITEELPAASSRSVGATLTLGGRRHDRGRLRRAARSVIPAPSRSPDPATLLDDTLTNTASGSVIQVDDGKTLTLSGTEISGGTINDFNTSGNGTIDVTGSSTISNAALNGGDVTIGDGVHLALDGSTVTGTSFDDTAGGTIQIDGAVGDTVHLNGVSITGGSFTVAAHGLVQTSGNVTLTNTGVTNDGTIEVTGGTLKITGTGSVADSDGNTGGTIQIDGGATLDLNASDTQNVSFSGTGGELKIDTASFGGNIVGLDPGDKIDLSTIGYGPGTTATYASDADNAGGTLTVTDGTNQITLRLVGDYTNGHFAGSDDGNHDLLITLNADDDAPAFTPGATAQTATVSEAPGVTGSTGTDDSTPAGGAFHFTDIDLTNRPTAVVTQAVTWSGGNLSDTEATLLEGGFQLPQVTNTNNGEIDWTYSITDGSLDFLGAGQTATVTSTITLTDQYGGKDTATVTVTVDGANDIPTITATSSGLPETPGVTNSGATDTATGTINFTDADVTDRPTVETAYVSFDYHDAAGNDLTQSLTPDQQMAVAELETALSLSATSGNANNGSYGRTYSVTDSALDFMAAGDKLVLTYSATVSDSHDGGTASTPITVTITGSDDAPTLGAPSSPVSTDENHAVTINGITVSDVDAGSSQIEVTLAAGHGAMSLADYSALDLLHVTNSDGSIELFGSCAAINTALAAGVVYTPGADYSGADTKADCDGQRPGQRRAWRPADRQRADRADGRTGHA